MTGDVFALAPKVELHLHLEGAIPLDTMWSLVVGNGGDPAVSSIDGLRAMLRYRDFPHFIETWTWMTDFLRTPDDFTVAAESVARSLADQRIVYAEASVSPTDFTRHGADVQQIVLAARAGLAKVPGVRVGLNVDLVRDTGPERAMRTLEQVIDIAAEAGVAGITIGGSEHDYPPGPFAAVYARAREAGLRCTAHAGEAAGPDSVWAALRALHAERIGHGVRAVEDAALVAYLVEHQIPLEVCPTSNLRTGVAADWESHPLHALLDAGANVTISTDDPTYFQCTLADEFRRLAPTSGRSMADLTLAAVHASWLPPDEQTALADEITRWWMDHDTPGQIRAQDSRPKRR